METVALLAFIAAIVYASMAIYDWRKILRLKVEQIEREIEEREIEEYEEYYNMPSDNHELLGTVILGRTSHPYVELAEVYETVDGTYLAKVANAGPYSGKPDDTYVVLLEGGKIKAAPLDWYWKECDNLGLSFGEANE